MVVRPAERDIHLSCNISAVDCVMNLSGNMIASFPGSKGSFVN